MELKTYFTILIRRWWIILLVLIAVSGASIYASKLIPPKYQAEASLRVVTPIGGTISDVSFQVAYADRLINTYAQIAASEQVMNEAKAKLNIDKLPDITIKTVPNSEIILITVADPDPSLAAKTANTLAEIIITKGQENNSNTNTNDEGIRILSTRQAELQKELDQAREDYTKLVNAYALTNSQISGLESTIRIKEANYQNLEDQYQQAVISEAVAVYNTIEVSAKTTKDILSAEMSKVDSELTSLRAQYQALSASSAKYSQELNSTNMRIQNKENAYSNLQSQIDSARVAASKLASTRDLMIASPAIVPTRPVIPMKLLIIGLGVICGLILGFVLALLYHNVDNRIFTIGQIEQVSDSPILGQLPSLSKKDCAAPLASKNTSVQKAYWTLCTKILAAQQSRPLKTIVVTSPNPAEGKSTVLMGIAMGLARSNRKVLLVDAALRVPRLHELLNAPCVPGFSNFLSGECELDDVIQEIANPAIHFIPGGVMPDDPAGLFQSTRFSALLERAASYDVVLFDSAALLPVPDTDNLAMHLDGILLVVRRKRTTTADIQEVLHQLDNMKGNLLGIVVNRDLEEKTTSYYQRLSARVSRLPNRLTGPVE